MPVLGNQGPCDNILFLLCFGGEQTVFLLSLRVLGGFFLRYVKSRHTYMHELTVVILDLRLPSKRAERLPCSKWWRHSGGIWDPVCLKLVLVPSYQPWALGQIA